MEKINFLFLKIFSKNEKEKIGMKIFSVDAETDGLYGESFAIGATVRENGREATFQGRIPDSKVSNRWVKKNVLPHIIDMSITCSSSYILEESFWKFWMENKEDAIVIAHCASPVETGLFRRCVERDLENRMGDGPYPAINDVATLLMLLGERIDSVDTYNNKYGIIVPFKGTSHHPMYDAEAAAVCWEHAFSRLTLK
ncbi:MAG: hypothetical protein L6Q29_03665 [Candidatus Pacebacteria bacterium]|nr:hypothetical protein [Candidatus Paceibacterota bacterium]